MCRRWWQPCRSEDSLKSRLDSAQLRHVWLWAQLWATNAVMIVALKLWSFQSIVARTGWLADRCPATWPASSGDLGALAALSLRRIQRRGLVRGRCLSRSLALFAVLRRYGVHGTIELGVLRRSPTFLAHAWVEVGGVPINAGPHVRTRYAAFARSFGRSRIDYGPVPRKYSED